MNILDVWFDSGSSHEAVLSVRPELSWPADLYLEGSDQHRGWFQSSLLVGLGTRGRPPYHQVVTHGFIVADDGRKMSKSLGNSIEPQEIIKASGADILRLWVSMSDFTQEIRLGKEVLARSVEAYRKIRNTLRYLVANLYDFDPTVDRLPFDDLEEIDRYILGRYGALAQRIVNAYADYDYATVFQGLNAFATIDLSAFYADVSKDRLYTFAARSSQRRSAQTAMYVMAEGLARLMAPILPFTADELWRFVPRTSEESVHIALFPTEAELGSLVDAELMERWTKLLATLERVLAEIEPLRKSKQIGSSLQAKVVLSATLAELALLERHAKDLPMLFIVSEVELRSVPTDVEAHEEALPRVTIERAAGVKCERCWRYVSKVSCDPAWAGLCERCQDALSPGDQAA
jgi:isoleucyl-tRNA synthetase